MTTSQNPPCRRTRRTRSARACLKLSLLVWAVIPLAADEPKSRPTYLRAADSGLSFPADADGYRIPDFSYAGYLSSNAPLPMHGSEYDTKVTLNDPNGDETKRIQEALDAVASLPINASGYRGAVTLGPGTWHVTTLAVSASGVVLRGSGRNATIVASERPARVSETIRLGSSAGTLDPRRMFDEGRDGPRWDITTPVVQVGATEFDVSGDHALRPGDRIIIEHPCTADWLDAVDRGGSPDPATQWKVDEVPIRYFRRVTKVARTRVSIDAPVMYTLVRARSQSFVFKYTATLVSHVGLEDLTVDHITESNLSEAHSNDCVRFNQVENGWARNVTAQNYKRSGFLLCESSRITLERCEAIDPHSRIRGSMRYGFNSGGAQLTLLRECYGRRNRHTFVGNGNGMDSGNVFLHCVADDAYAASETGHQRWYNGSLFDGCTFRNIGSPETGAKFSDRAIWLGNHGANAGGHGWAAVTAVLYKCVLPPPGYAIINKPPTGMNYVIDCWGDFRSQFAHFGDHPGALSIGVSGALPRSLFEAQLAQRRTPESRRARPASTTR